MADWCAAAEITLVTDAVGGRQTFYVATHGFSSATSDTPASTAFRELLEDPGGPARSMFSGARVTGPIAIDAGTLKLKNGAGEFDDWPTDYGTAGGTVVVRWGRVGDAYPSAWTLVYRAEIKSLSVDLDYCALGLRNRLYLLDKPVVTDVFAGTGGLEGTGTTSKRKQIAIDEPGYIPLVLLDSVKQLYFVQANASDVRALAGTFPPYYYVFDGGVALTHGGYYTTAADFANGAAPAAGYFKVWAEGWDTTGASAGNAPGPLYVRLGSPPANDLRIATLGYLMNVGDAPTNIRRWKLTDLCNRAGMLDVTPGAMGSRSVNLELGGRLLQGDESYLDVMTDVCKWRHAAVGFTRDDRFFCRELLDPLDTSDPADTVRYVFTEHNAKQFKRTPIPGADAPIWQVSVNAGKTWPCQVANGAPAAVREAMLREPWQTSFTGTSDEVKASNPGAGTAKVDIVGNVFVTKSDKQAFVNRYLMLHGGRRDYLQLRCTQVDADTLALELGDKVQVLHARMGCTPARTFRVVRIEPADLVSREPGIVFGLWGGAAGPAASVLGGGSSSGSPGGSGAPGPTSIGTVSMGEFTGTVRSSVSGVLAAGANVDMGQFIQVCYSSVTGGALGLVVYEAENASPSETVTGAPVTARADFMARLTVSGVEDFESYTEFDPIYALATTINGTSATFSTTSFPFQILTTTFDGQFNTTSGGDAYAQVVPLTITFGAPIAAFGAYFTDPGDFGGQVTVTLNRTGGGTQVIDITHAISGPSGNLVFWGFVDDAETYDSLTITSDEPSESAGMDDIVVATAAQLS